MTISNSEYWQEVLNIAKTLVEDAASATDCDNAETFDQDTIRDYIFDSALHQAIDSHQWVIYYGYNLPVLQHSDNAEYGIDEFGSDWIADTVKSGGLSGLHSALAFWALYADVMGYIDDAITDYEAALNADA